MTELLHQDRLRLIAVNTTHHPLPKAPRRVPTLQWALDPGTGRPVAQWVVAEQAVTGWPPPSRR